MPGEVELTITFIGMEPQVITADGKKSLTIYMEQDVSELDEVVANGYFQKSQNSFTGSATTIKAAEIQTISITDMMSAISILDPSFQIAESDFGSNPNRLPEIEMRGKGSFYDPQSPSAQYDPNRPTFILDGFEVSLQTVVDLNMDRVESITLLKDAAATAVYGSRAANGVVVIATKREQSGKMRIDYNFSLNIQAPDLSSYNLTNAAEKLDVEKAAGHFQSSDPSNPVEQLKLDQLYNARLYNVQRGVDTDWMAQPLRTGIGQRHSLDFTGGDGYMTYGISLGFTDNQGVMKESFRKNYDITSRLQYVWKNVTFRNQLRGLITNRNESPYGNYSQYATLNPYYKMRDENGNLQPSLGSEIIDLVGFGETFQNPVYEAEDLNNKNFGKAHSLSDSFSVNWAIGKELRLKRKRSI